MAENPVKAALEEGPTEEAAEGESEYDAFVGRLQDLLGVDESKARELREVICGLAKYEMEMGSEEEPAPSEPKPGEKKKGKADFAMILGG